MKHGLPLVFLVNYLVGGFGHPSEKYEVVNWDDDINPIFLGKMPRMATIHHQQQLSLVTEVVKTVPKVTGRLGYHMVP